MANSTALLGIVPPWVWGCVYTMNPRKKNMKVQEEHKLERYYSLI